MGKLTVLYAVDKGLWGQNILQSSCYWSYSLRVLYAQCYNLPVNECISVIWTKGLASVDRWMPYTLTSVDRFHCTDDIWISFQVNWWICLFFALRCMYVMPTYVWGFSNVQNPSLVPDVDHGPRGLRWVLCMQAAGSVDHPLPPQSDTGGWGSVTGGRGLTIQVGGVGSKVGGSDCTGEGWGCVTKYVLGIRM